MDFIGLIREQRDQFAIFRSPQGIDAVLKHLEIATTHFQTGRISGESHLFTDVIYRTNQVFEGILKESFAILADQAPDGKTPSAIEKHFAGNKIFRQRVIDYFTLYRTDWRNKSTHDYQLDFDEQEAILAIATVSAFCFVAIGQMLQKLASDSVSAICHPPAGPPNYGTVAATIVAELPDVIRAVIAGTALGRIDEMVLRGAIEGLMKSLWPASFIVSESYVQFEGQRLRPDIVLEWKSEKLVIELKSTRDVDRTIAGLGLREQLSQYAQAISATGAIGIVIPKTFPLNRTPVFATTPVRNMSVPMIIIHPSRD